MNKNLLCKDCKNSFVPVGQWIAHLGIKPLIDPLFYHCKRTKQEKHIEFNPVTGNLKVETTYKSCLFTRMESQECGPNAKHWVPRHKKHLFLAITRGKT